VQEIRYHLVRFVQAISYGEYDVDDSVLVMVC